MRRAGHCQRLSAISPSGIVAAAILLSVLTGCRTVPPPPLVQVAGPGWTVREGQAIWQPRARFPELSGEIVLATHTDGRYLLQFTKTPLPLIVASANGDAWQIRFVPEKRTFSGYGLPPARFLWLFLPDALAGRKIRAAVRFEARPDSSWHLENAQTGETLQGYLTP